MSTKNGRDYPLSLTIRTIRMDDLSAVMRFVADIPEIHVAREHIAASLKDTNRCTLVAADDGSITGFISAAFMSPEAEIFDIAVQKDRRRAGVGKALLDAFFAEARSRGVHVVFLEVADDNPARMFYERCGFEPLSVRKDYYAKGRSAVVMRRDL